MKLCEQFILRYIEKKKRQNTFKKKDLNKSEHKKIENLTETHILLNLLPETS